MSHKSALAALLPLDFSGLHDDDLTVEGLNLDRMADDIETLRQSIMNEVVELLPSSDRIKLAPARGDIKQPHFVILAAFLGYTIQINDYVPTMPIWSCAGEALLEDPWQYFNSGNSMAGDYLAQEDRILPWLWEIIVTASPDIPPVPDLETLFNQLKPADVQLNFTFP